jgi:hypothetical protein
MKQTFIILISLVLFNSCLENKKELNDENDVSDLEKEFEQFDPIAYVSNPAKTDELCISEIEKAKTDIKKEGIVFTQVVGFLFGHNRYENELKELCKQKGLKYDIDLIGCVVFEGQTQGCYGAYMDKALSEKYGSNFKENMHQKADSLFLVNAIDRTVYYGDLDNRPRLPSENKRNSDDLGYVYFENSEIKIESNKWNDLPFMDIGFIVHKDSTISNFNVSNFVAKGNNKFKTDLFNLAVNKIKTEYPIWIPGSIKGILLESDNNIRIHFRKK